MVRVFENVLTNISQHLQSICRYFGEKIDDTDAEVLKTYCDGMCDVSRPFSSVKNFLIRFSRYANILKKQNLGLPSYLTLMMRR